MINNNQELVSNGTYKQHDYFDVKYRSIGCGSIFVPHGHLYPICMSTDKVSNYLQLSDPRFVADDSIEDFEVYESVFPKSYMDEDINVGEVRCDVLAMTFNEFVKKYTNIVYDDINNQPNVIITASQLTSTPILSTASVNSGKVSTKHLPFLMKK